MDLLLQALFTLLFANNLTMEQYNFHLFVLMEMILKYKLLDSEVFNKEMVIKNRDHQYEIYKKLYFTLKKITHQ